MTFEEKHAGEKLPLLNGKETAGAVVKDGQPDAALIPLSVHGLVIPVTETEALGIIGQITAIMQTRRPGVMANGN